MRAYLLTLLLGCALGIIPFVDIAEPIKDAKCIVAKTKVISLRVLLPNGEIDPLFAKNAALLREAARDVYIGAYAVPCLKCNPAKQWADIKQAIEEAEIDHTVSVLVDGAWTPNFAYNIQFLRSFLAERTAAGIKGAIITHEMAWRRIMNGVSDFKSFRLWWINNDNNPENNFKPFAGWTADMVVAKQYSVLAPVCDNRINLDSQYF